MCLIGMYNEYAVSLIGVSDSIPYPEAELYVYTHEQLFVIPYQVSRGRNYFDTLQRESKC